jgi:hypothetical protein
LVAWLPVGCQLDTNGTAVTLTLEEHVSAPSPKSRTKGIGPVAHILVRFGARRKRPFIDRCCAGFWTTGCRHYPRALAAGVQKAPRHEIA